MEIENPIITFENVSKEYTLCKNDNQRFVSLFKEVKGAKKHMALKDVNLKIAKGEAVGIIGANGAGKSTLLKMITGVTFPTSGQVTVNGKVAALLELTAGFSAQMTGRENIYLKGYILGLTDEYIKQIEERVIEFAELG
ncbi:MAG: ATP-binding cassette domain-containing protein, partial [Eubacterium sp.]|nr:ATP-binding cassette domain-containing protein [Eubacterium sp.]